MEYITNLHNLEEFQDFDNLELIAKEVVEGFITGLHRSPFHGFSVEFSEHRQYNEGESTKNIDWKLFGRTERLYVKQFEEETNLRCHLVIDTSSSMLFPFNKGKGLQMNKLTFSVYCSAALIYMMRRQRDASGLTLFSDKVDFHSNARLSSVHLDLLYNNLSNLLKTENVGLKRETNAVPVLHQIAENIHKRSLVVIFSDMIESSDPEELYAALQHLRYNKHEVVLFHVTDKKHEEELVYSNRPHKFIDLETGETIRVKPQELKRQYAQMMKAYVEELKLKCGQYHIDIIEADINDDFRHVLQSYLIKRGRLS
ncbi:MAG TPA: DUF58 domain-containing protein [Prolixibacteraceae bacterium]|nr:DUF58 domain-containing protein [Prolixibacteraceae bacterium]HPS12452.1 DUF58 domain-containing protein [Prolixibacteraceae bacterium]